MTCAVEELWDVSVLHLQRGRLLMNPFVHFGHEHILDLPHGRGRKFDPRHFLLHLQTHSLELRHRLAPPRRYRGRWEESSAVYKSS